MKSLLLMAGVCLTIQAAAAHAQQFQAGAISIEKPWARATPKGAKVAGGYMTLVNKGAKPDRLIGAAADFAGIAQIHEMTMANGMMDMHEVASGLAIPAHGTVALTPGRYHLMFMQLKRPLLKGETVKATLRFERAGAVPIVMKVGGLGDRTPPH